VYDSKTMWEYELGRTHEMLGKDSAARDAYQRALVEDLSFYPAHDRLAYLALQARDTATAVTELQRAIEIQGDDFSARLVLGRVQAARRAYGPATEQLRRATEIEPWAAQPHFLLGQVLEGAGDRNGAVAEYQRFLALAARGGHDVDTARRRLAGLSAPAP
jgi:tetratricopeptide (TPR) repeat protein